MMDLRHERTGTSEREIVVGVDTHKDFHVAVALDSGGALLQTRSFPATAAGYQDLIEWVGGFGLLRRAGVEGTGAYGAGLTRALHRVGVAVTEVNRPDRAVRRRRGKTDAIDAEAAARAVLAGSASAVAKTGDGPVEALRVLKLVKDSAVKARVQAINQTSRRAGQRGAGTPRAAGSTDGGAAAACLHRAGPDRLQRCRGRRRL